MSVAVPPGAPAWVADVLTAWVGQVSEVPRALAVAARRLGRSRV